MYEEQIEEKYGEEEEESGEAEGPAVEQEDGLGFEGEVY